ncbi:MAG: BON domain-containing protein [Deltaproteobacteria bacterium]|nr:BON domain-containing protein [Deltaproteobacteria bacterium]
MQTKETIVKGLRAALEHERKVNLHRYPIDLRFVGEDLVVTGEAENIAAKKIALEIVGASGGIERIVDRLRVAPAERMGDAAIRDHVRDALLQEPALSACSIRTRSGNQMETVRQVALEPAGEILIEVGEGAVTLNGQVPSLSHKRLAGVLAWWVPGSRDVINGLEDVPPEQDNDDEVADAVRLILEKDPFVPAGQIKVSVHDYVVTLEGLAPDEEVKRMAEFDAWYTFGVDKVVNRLEVQRT